MATAQDIAAGRFVERRSVEEAAAFIKGTVTPGEVILLKSARNLHLERILLSFELKVRCWEQACRKKEDCVQCGSYAIPFAGLREIEERRKKQQRLKPSRWEAMLIRGLPGIAGRVVNTGDDDAS